MFKSLSCVFVCEPYGGMKSCLTKLLPWANLGLASYLVEWFRDDARTEMYPCDHEAGE